ncbi:MAG: glycolate oxidase FAD binding subunit [Motiliproteus sp.]|jgi:glycolate oxidase FAD binding subunit
MTDISQQLQDQILTARASGRTLNIVGGGSKAFMGRAPDQNAEPLNLAPHSGIVSYEPVELVLTARAGTRLSEIEAALAEHNQMLTFEPPHFSDQATLGGTLACNQSGAGRPWWGSVRDQVLGVRLLNGRGEHLRFGGQVMKNVAGYDVSRLQAGAMGTLGAITEVSLKVLPKPLCNQTLVREMDLDAAIDLMTTRAAEPKPLTAACWLDGRLYLRLSGSQLAVRATIDHWQERVLEEGEGTLFWRGLGDQALAFFQGEQPLWRFSVRPTASNPSLDGNWLIDWGGAQRWYRGSGERARMEALAAEMGGQVSLFRGGDRQAEVMHTQSPALQLIQQRLKYSFDPDGLFNSGRLYSWL